MSRQRTLYIALTISGLTLLMCASCTNADNSDTSAIEQVAITPATGALPQSLVYDADITDAFDTSRLCRIDSAFSRLINEGQLPHCVTFVAHNGRVVHNKAFGYRDIENQIECKTDDIFRIASQTKAVCVVALMTLFEEGRFQIDEPIKKYIPEFAQPQVLQKYNPKTGKYTTRPAKRDITIRDLLTHTSGLCYEGVFENICKQKAVYPHPTLDSITLADNVAHIATMPLAHDPGEKFTYSMNIEVLGRLCEILSGKDLNTFIHERVLDPLGMQHTYFYVPQAEQSRVVKLYQYTKKSGLQVSDKTVLQQYPYSGAQVLYSPGAGLCGTIEDYAKFCQMILNNGEFNGHRILGRKTLEMMQKNGVGTMRGEIGFGMAWDVFTPENAHNTIVSEGSMRWGGMFGTDYLIDPKEKLIVLMYTNCMPNYSGVNPKTLLHNTVYQALK